MIQTRLRCDHGSSAGRCMQDDKSPYPAVTISDNLVNSRANDFWLSTLTVTVCVSCLIPSVVEATTLLQTKHNCHWS